MHRRGSRTVCLGSRGVPFGFEARIFKRDDRRDENPRSLIFALPESCGVTLGEMRRFGCVGFRKYMSKLLTITQLSAEIGVKTRTVRSWMQDRKIPFIRTGHRTVLFAPDRVLAALSKFEIKPVGARK